MKSLFNFIVFLSLFLVLVRCGKKDTIIINNENKRDILLQYGKQNPENNVIIETGFGTIRLRLYDETPLHRANFIKLIKDGYYDQPEFYRIVQNFVVQGGVPMKKLDYTVPAEFNPKFYHKKGALGMARLDDNNPGKESSSTEFYIVHGNKYADWEYDEEEKNIGLTTSAEQRKLYTTIGGEMSLDTQYTVFGEVVEGLDVIDKIASVKVYSSERPYKKIPFEIKLARKIKRSMKKLILLFVVGITGLAASPVSDGYQVGDMVTDFKLKNVDGKMISLADFKNAKGFIIIFDCNTCPMSRAYNPRIIALNKKFAPQGFPVVLINPNSAELVPEESFDEMKNHAKDHGYDFPYLYDESQEVVRKFNPTNTPHTFVLNKTSNGLKVAYIGAIDNNSRDASKADKHFVEDAVSELLAGKTVTVTKTKAIGCSVKLKNS